MIVSQDPLNQLRSMPIDGDNLRNAVRVMEDAFPATKRLIEIEQSAGAIANRILNLASHDPYLRDVERQVLDLLAQRVKDTNLMIMFSRLNLRKCIRPQLGGNLAENANRIRTWMAENPHILSDITELDLIDLNLTALPPEIELCHHLKILNLRGTQIASLPKTLTLPHLWMLNLSNTPIALLPKSINLPHLQWLDLSRTPITSLPKSVILHNLRWLYLNNTSIASLPKNLNLPHLERLDLSGTHITSPPETFHLPNLNVLDLRHTPLEKIGVVSFSDWKVIQNSNLLKMFSRLVMQIPQDQRPTLSGSLIEDAMTIRAWMKDHRDLLDQIIELNLNSLDLTILPPEIELLENLRTLRLYGNPIVFLPDHLTLPNLRMLDLANTQIDSLPKHLNLPSLESLYLTHTPIFALPETLNLPKLVVLDLDNTKIAFLPNNLGDNLFNLRGLYLRNTPIASLPEELFFPWLRVLDLKNTKISSLSHEFVEKNFPNLWVLETDEPYEEA